MTDRPESFRYDSGIGTVKAVYPDAWECDVLAEDGGIVQRALVIGSKLPELSTAERPQWVEYAFASHLQGRPVCRPIQSRLPGARLPRASYVYFDEIVAKQADGTVKGFRITVDRSGNLEILSLTDPLRQIRILDQDGVVRLDTPSVRAIFNESDKSARVQCDGDGELTAGGNATVTAGGTATLKGAAIVLDGPVTITGDVALTGSLNATGTVIDASGNTNHHSHG